MPDPRILPFYIPADSTHTHFQIQFSVDQMNWADLKVGGVTALSVSLLSGSVYTLDGVNATDDANNNKAVASTPPNWYRFRLQVSNWSNWSGPCVYPSQEDFMAGMKSQLADPSFSDPTEQQLLSDPDYLRHLANACQAYEAVYARRIYQVQALTTGIQQYALPTLWDEEFSFFDEVEYPYGLIPRSTLQPHFLFVDMPRRVWRFQRILPVTGESAALYFTARHSRDGATIPSTSFESVLMWACGDAAQQLRGKANQWGNVFVGSDYVQNDPKVREWARIATDYKEQAEKIWGSPTTGMFTHTSSYDYHGVPPPSVWSGYNG